MLNDCLYLDAISKSILHEGTIQEYEFLYLQLIST